MRSDAAENRRSPWMVSEYTRPACALTDEMHLVAVEVVSQTLIVLSADAENRRPVSGCATKDHTVN